MINTIAATATKTTNVKEQSAATTKMKEQGKSVPTTTNLNTLESITAPRMTMGVTPQNDGK